MKKRVSKRLSIFSLRKVTYFFVCLCSVIYLTGFVSNTPQEIAKFVRIYKNNFDPVEIGDYLGEGGSTEMEVLFYNQVRYWYTRAVSFVEMEFEPALR